jgi:hypothetical protein
MSWLSRYAEGPPDPWWEEIEASLTAAERRELEREESAAAMAALKKGNGTDVAQAG